MKLMPDTIFDMLHYVKGNLLESQAQTLVNTVNTVGVMGKGIALQFKNLFPANYRRYVKACKNDELKPGVLLVTEDESLLSGKKIIINFPTKTHWRLPSQYSYIESGLKELIRIIQDMGIRSVAVPPLGCGNGGLEWTRVKEMMERYLSNVDAEIFIYQPDMQIKEINNKDNAELTPARAMLLAVMYESVRHAELVSEFAAEKISWFLQRFGAEQEFKLDFQPHIYGPYSGKIRHVLHYLNGAYITGFESKDKKPFDEIGMITDAEQTVLDYLQQPGHEKYRSIVDQTKQFLDGHYAVYNLELLSSVDYIRLKKNTQNTDDIIAAFNAWNDRKKKQFTNRRFVESALAHLDKYLYNIPVQESR